jgi:hypothetical protein
MVTLTRRHSRNVCWRQSTALVLPPLVLFVRKVVDLLAISYCVYVCGRVCREGRVSVCVCVCLK